MSMTAAYVRCSLDEQAVSGLGLESQRAAIRAFCQMRGLAEPRWFEDPGESGADPLADRPAGKELVELADAGPCTIIVYKLDRLFRSAADAITKIADWHSRGIVLVSVQEGLDLSSPYGRFVAGLFALIAQLEREVIVERTVGAMAVKRERGERISRHAEYGFHFEDSGRRNGAGEPIMVEVPDQAEQDVIREIREMNRRGKSLREIGAELDARRIKPRSSEHWSHTTIRKILRQHKGRKLECAPGPVDNGVAAAPTDPLTPPPASS